MITEEVHAKDEDELERLVKTKEEQGWSRQGEVEIIHPAPPKADGVVGLISFCQVMTKTSEDDATPQD